MTTHSRTFYRVIMAGLAMVFLVAGCKKSERELAEQKSLERHEQETALKNGFIRQMKGPYAGQMYDGLRFLIARKVHNHLPGLSPRDDVRLDAIKTEGGLAGPWAFTLEIHLVTRPPTRYCDYLLVQTYSNADFQIKKAWRTDKAGKTVETFPGLEPIPADPRVHFLGPANPGSEIGFAHWYQGATGGGSVAVDTGDPATGYADFKIGIQAEDPQGTNHADLRCEMFPLEKATNNPGPLTFAFKYKIPGKVKPGDNLDVDLRFFGPDNDNFLGQEVYHVGSSSGDSEMTEYKSMTLTNIFPTEGAVKADVWVVANIGGPWTSGEAEFDDFSVTTAVSRQMHSLMMKMGLGLGLALGVVVVMAGLWWRSKRRARRTS